MAGVPEKVLNWLYSILTSEYADVNRTYHDAAETLSHFPSLSPRTEVYTYENGTSALLLRVGGTLPVTFRGATYGFPVAIWVPHAYPREPPIVYVTPSQDMLVRPGQHVSGDGRIYHPYLAQWGKYWDKSTIFDFLAVLRGIFAKEPPVRSKQQPQQQQQQQFRAPAPQIPPPVPPTPIELRRSMQGTPIPSPSPGHSSAPPAPPPKPPKPFEQKRASSQSSQDQYSHPPPVPPHPPHLGQQQQQQHQYQSTQGNIYTTQNSWSHQIPHIPQAQNASQRQASFDMSPATPAIEPLQPHTQAQGNLTRSYELGSPVSPITPEDQRNATRSSKPAPQPSAGFPPAQQYQSPPPPPQKNGQYQYQQNPQHVHVQPSISQQYHHRPTQDYPPQHHPQYVPHHQSLAQHSPPAPKPPIDLLDDSLEVTLPSQRGNQMPLPVPPVPPNPEKDALLKALSEALVSQIRRTVSSNTSAITPLRAQQAALQNAYSRLQSELGELQQLDAALASNENILRNAMIEADRVMEDAQRRKAPDVDDVLVAPTVVGGQLYILAAEERGIADALFVLGRALDKGRVSSDIFIKQTRSLAREQFIKKALIKKIAKGMALDEYQMR